jgi:hypothetical protein
MKQLIHGFQANQQRRKDVEYKARGVAGHGTVKDNVQLIKRRRLNMAELGEIVLPAPPSVNPASPPLSPFSPPPGLSLIPASLGQHVHASYVRSRYQARKEYLGVKKEVEEAGIELDPDTVPFADILEDKRETERAYQEEELWKEEMKRAQEVRARIKRDVEKLGWAPIRACYDPNEGICVTYKGDINQDEKFTTVDAEKGVGGEQMARIEELEDEAGVDVSDGSGKKRKFDEIVDVIDTADKSSL